MYNMKACLFSIEGTRKGHLFCQNGKELGFGAEPPRIVEYHHLPGGHYGVDYKMKI